MHLPFLLTPAAKDYLWGGNRLNEEFNKGIQMSPLAETWECSTHPDGQSTVDGTPLGDVLAAHPDYLGTHAMKTAGGKPELPILIKLIDAKTDLSVQVHPDDAYAQAQEGGRGKIEMWYVLNATDGAELVFGFKQNMDKDRVRAALQNGTIGAYLNHVPVHKNDLFWIEPGTVHAIGAGCLMAEIQESSTITYRLFDYNRVDKTGKKRELHIDKALDVADLTSSAAPRQPMRVLKYQNGCATELLARCKYFQVERLLLNTEMRKTSLPFKTGKNSFHAQILNVSC